MALRAPLYWNGTELQEMDSGTLQKVHTRMCWLWAASPNVNLSRVATNGSLASMTDDRYQAGSATQRTDRFATNVETPDRDVTGTVTYDHIDETVGTGPGYPANTNNRAYPVYWDTATNSIQAMTQQDFIDTFVDGTTTLLQSGSTTSDLNKKQGTYFASTTTSVAGATLVSPDVIFIDTTADASLYTSAGIPEARDQPRVENNYYLHRYDQQAEPTGADAPPLPLYLPAGTDVQQYTQAEFDTLSLTFLQEAIVNEVGQRIRYLIQNASYTGNNTGTSILNTRLNGNSSSGYTTRFVSADDYRTQEFPNGVPQVISTGNYQLRIQKS